MLPATSQERSTFSSPREKLCRRFSLSEIHEATKSFDDGLVVGQGGFGKVYKGSVDNGKDINTVVAVKRLDSKSNQGAPEFWAEIEMLSKLRHCHLVSLIGYCNESSEMVLVYEFMHHGTLADHLHNKVGTTLSWVQRVKICIGAARGSDYLHTGTGTQQGIIHRDVKSSNILLDENWAAKISDFGLSKTGPTNQSLTYVNTCVKGTFGYVDPEYFLTGKLTRKSDVYAFGVVLFEVLCGRRAVDTSLDEEEWSLTRWAQDCMKKGKLDRIIDSSLRGQISPKCLKGFAQIAERCLASSAKQRPTMAEVVVGLNFALSLQERTNTSVQPAGILAFTRKVQKIFFPPVTSDDVRTLGMTENQNNELISPNRGREDQIGLVLARKKDGSVDPQPETRWLLPNPGWKNKEAEIGNELAQADNDGGVRSLFERRKSRTILGLDAKHEEFQNGLNKKDESDWPLSNMRQLQTTPWLRNLPNHVHGEQVAAGWPPWLSAVAGEAIIGWTPCRADNFEKLDKIGQGTHCNVYKARDIVADKFVALKKVRFDIMEPESVKFMAREILILRRLNHPNVIKLEGVVTSRMSSSVYLVLEYMEADLAGVSTNTGIKLAEPQVKSYMRQLFSGLEHCHNHHVLHRDIKSSDLLLNNKGELKIAGFSSASFFNPIYSLPMTSQVCSLWYRSPELLLGETEHGVGVDLWSAGCILAELLVGRPIMTGFSEVEQLHKIFRLCGSPSEEYWNNVKLLNAKNFKPQKPYKRCISETFRDYPYSAIRLLEALLEIDPAKRQTASDALRSKYFLFSFYTGQPSTPPKYPPGNNTDKLQDDDVMRWGKDLLDGLS